MNLAFAPFGVVCEVKGINAETNLKRHLENLGFVPGAKVVSLYDNKGDVIVKTGNSKLALSKVVALKITVEQEEEKC